MCIMDSKNIKVTIKYGYTMWNIKLIVKRILFRIKNMNCISLYEMNVVK